MSLGKVKGSQESAQSERKSTTRYGDEPINNKIITRVD